MALHYENGSGSISGSHAHASGPARAGARIPFDAWIALPLPQPHYRGAPALWSDNHAARVLETLDARLVPLDDRQFTSAPGGVIVLDTQLPRDRVQELARTVMLA